MLMTTSELNVEYEVLGLVKGSCMEATHLGRDILAGLRKLVGGRVSQYADLLQNAREEAVEEMISEAEKLQADAVICVRFSTSTITSGAAEVIVYGTAVRM